MIAADEWHVIQVLQQEYQQDFQEQDVVPQELTTAQALLVTALTVVAVAAAIAVARRRRAT